MTEQEEQVMIEKAKAGDPQANYQMCLWALEQAKAEPEEERWKRLAAKCLVQSAQAGYNPAQKKMEDLISGQKTYEPDEDQVTLDGWNDVPAQPAVPVEEPTEETSDEFSWAQPLTKGRSSRSYTVKPESDFAGPEEEDGQGEDPLVKANAALDRLRAAFGHDKKPEPKPEEEPEYRPETKPRRFRTSGGKDDLVHSLKEKLQTPANWSEKIWRKVEIGCVIVGVAMVILIVVLIVTGGKDGKAGGQNAPSETAQTMVTLEPTVEPFPSTTLRSEIQSATTLDYFPLDEQYLTASETRQVSAEGGLNLRRGPPLPMRPSAPCPTDCRWKLMRPRTAGHW